MELPSLNEFSLWLEPKGENYERINSFALKLQKPTSSPNFVPHITLLSDIPFTAEKIKEQMGKIANNTTPFEITFKKISAGDNYFKSFFLECNESTELMNLNKFTQNIFDVNKQYLPHMSILYGNTKEQFKKELFDEVQKQGMDFFSFEIKTISLWHALGTVEEWKKIIEVPLLNKRLTT